MDTLWRRQVVWSRAASSVKARLTSGRSVALGLGAGGALLETAAATAPPEFGTPRAVLAYAGAFLLACIPLVRSYWLAPTLVSAWARARSASEGIKSEIYTFLARAAPYDTEDRLERLKLECRRIEESVRDLERHALEVSAIDATPPGWLPGDDYLKARVLEQVTGYYRPQAESAARSSRRFRGMEIALGVAAAAIGVFAGSSAGSASWMASFGAWSAVLTTIAGALATHAAASRFDFLVMSYGATARRLEDLALDWQTAGAPAQGSSWSEFVKHCEDAISIENESWMAKWVEPEKTAAT